MAGPRPTSARAKELNALLNANMGSSIINKDIGKAPNTFLPSVEQNLSRSLNLTSAENPQMRNVTPRSGAGIGSAASGGLLLNPVAATLGALAATTGTAGKGAEPVLYGNREERLKDPIKYGMPTPEDLAPPQAKLKPFTGPTSELVMQGLAPASQSKPKPFTGPTSELVMQGLAPASQSAPEQRSPMEQQMVAPKAIPAPEPVDANRAAALFAKTHGTSFDPKSIMDRRKMQAITSLMGQAGSESLTPNQFALKIYRSTKK